MDVMQFFEEHNSIRGVTVYYACSKIQQPYFLIRLYTHKFDWLHHKVHLQNARGTPESSVRENDS